MKKLVVLLVVSAFAAVLAGCQTIQGAGRDIQKAGESIEKAMD